MERTIVHIDLDSFFVSCERLQHPELRNIPLIIGSTSDRGIVASCSAEAAYYGVRRLMPVRNALQLCPNARVLNGDYERYSRISSLITEIIEEQAPVTEKAGIDQFYLDVSGLDRFHGCYKWTRELAMKINRESGLPLSFGLSVNKTVAKMATDEARPAGEKQVRQPEVLPFIFPLSIQRLPGLGQVTFELLSRIGVRKIETLATMPAAIVQQLLGKQGLVLWKKSNGVDNTPVVPLKERKSMSAEETFQNDTTDIALLRTVISGMVEKLCFQLRNEEKLTSVVSIRIRYANFDTHTRQSRVTHTAQDHTLRETALQLFDHLYQRRMLLRLVGVSFSGLIRGSQQIHLLKTRMNAFHSTRQWIKSGGDMG